MYICLVPIIFYTGCFGCGDYYVKLEPEGSITSSLGATLKFMCSTNIPNSATSYPYWKINNDTPFRSYPPPMVKIMGYSNITFNSTQRVTVGCFFPTVFGNYFSSIATVTQPSRRRSGEIVNLDNIHRSHNSV